MNDQQLFEIAAKLHNLSLKDLRLKKRYLDAVVIETAAGAKYTHLVAELEEIATPGAAEIAAEIKAVVDDEQPAVLEQPARPTRARKR